MVLRLQKLKTRQSLFLFGARGTGKSTLIRKCFLPPHTLWLDLLNYKEESVFLKNPDRLSFLLSTKKYKTVVIDEVQKVPKLLDIVHKGMAVHPEVKFVMTGSSSRKLKRGQANMLAGRAVTCYLYPFSCFELKNNFDLNQMLCFGSLPGLYPLNSRSEKTLFLESYVQHYLKEEVLQEQLIRNIQPFKNFLEVAGQLNGQIINYAKFSRDTGADPKTIQQYFSILEDTLLGFFLPAYHRSVRKQQQQAPKFYLFDTGVKRALEGSLILPLRPGTFAFGQAFEHFILLECIKLNHYLRKRFKFFYLRTKNGQEVDLIIQRPGKKELLVEIKSTTTIRRDHIQILKKLAGGWKVPHTTELWSLDTGEQKVEGVKCLYWKKALQKLFGTK